MSADAKGEGKSPPKLPGGPADPTSPTASRTSPGVAPAPGKLPAPPPAAAAAGAAKPKAPPPIAPPKPAGAPPLVAPPPAIGKPIAPPPPAAAKPPAPQPLVAPAPAALRPAPPSDRLSAPKPAASVAAAPVPRPAPAVPAAAAPAPVPSEIPPPLEIPADIAAIAAQLDARPPRTTMDFLFELDSPVPSSAEIDLRGMPDVQAAIADSNLRDSMPAPAEAELPELPRDSFHPVASTSESIEPPPLSARELSATGDAVPRSVARVSLKPVSIPASADEQHDVRRRRLITRIVTCRDAFRVLGFLDIKESDRSEIARLMMALDPALDPSGKTEGVAKEPAALLAKASKEQLDRVERLVSPVEDKLLALDDLVTDQALATRVEAGKITAKTLCRYGRLLVSRRMQAGPRRDRFEWIATALLTRKNPDGTRTLVNADRAARVLELLIGGLVFKPKDEELEEAVEFLNDALERLRGFKNHEEFFESEFFIDVHGYKVTMRELLLSPDFVYLSVAVNAGLHNRVEEWVAAMERVHKSNQLMQDGSPREHLARRLRDQEAAVADIFGVKPRAAAPASVRPPAVSAAPSDKRKVREVTKPNEAAKQREAAKPRDAVRPKKGAQAAKAPPPKQPGGAGRLLMVLLTIIMLGGLLYAGYYLGVINVDDLRKLGVPGLPQSK